MKPGTLQNQKGFGIWDVVFWFLLAAIGFWLYRQYLSHPDGLKPRPMTHSAYEDKS